MRFLIFSVCSLALFVGTNRAEDPTKGKTYKTPKAAFEAMRNSYRAMNFAEFYKMLTKRSQQQALTETLSLAMSVYHEEKTPDNPQAKEMIARLRKSLTKFGLTKEKLLAIEKFNGKGRKDREAYYAGVARKLIKDLPNFVDAMAKVMFKMQARKGGKLDLELVGDLKVKGNVARGKMKLHLGDEPESQQTIMFVKVGNGWKVAMSEAQEEDRASRKVDTLGVVEPKEKD